MWLGQGLFVVGLPPLIHPLPLKNYNLSTLFIRLHISIKPEHVHILGQSWKSKSPNQCLIEVLTPPRGVTSAKFDPASFKLIPAGWYGDQLLIRTWSQHFLRSSPDQTTFFRDIELYLQWNRMNLTDNCYKRPKL